MNLLRSLPFALCLAVAAATVSHGQPPSTTVNPAYPMDASTILNAVESALAAQVAANDGVLTIAETLEDALEMLAVAPGQWRAVITMDGDEGAEDINPAGLVVGTLLAYIQAPKGLERPRRSLTHAARNGTPSFFTRRDWLIRKIRGLSLVHQEISNLGFIYRGAQWLKVENTPLYRAMMCRFELTYALDDPATDPDGSEPVVLPVNFRITGSGDDYYVIAFNGTAHGRIPRYAAEAGDPPGLATGYAIADTGEDYYVVTLDGVPHGRLPRFAV